MGPKNVEWFVDILKSAAYDMPALEVQFEYVKSELEDIQHKKNKSINEVNELNDRIAYLQSSEQSLSESCNGLTENIENFKNEQERLDTFTEMYNGLTRNTIKSKR